MLPVWVGGDNSEISIIKQAFYNLAEALKRFKFNHLAIDEKIYSLLGYPKQYTTQVFSEVL